MSSYALGADEKIASIHTSGDRTLYDRNENKVELIGNAAVHQRQESLFADKIIMEVDTKIVHAIGNATFVGNNLIIQAAEMHMNLETRTGTIISGRVSTPELTLSGERINKLGANRFQTHRGEYTTCKDCPQSWVLAAEDVDLQIDGYAYLSNVTVRVVDAPAVWFPYMIVPIKTKRQSGLLFPTFGFTNLGVTFIQPFFWAINKSLDMTFGAGTIGGRGRRLEWEGRYALNDGAGKANFWHLNDRAFKDYLAKTGLGARAGYANDRSALLVEQSQALPFNIEEKLRLIEVSDNLYRSEIGDVPGAGEAFLTSDLSLTHTNDKISSYVSIKRYRNLLSEIDIDPTTAGGATAIDPRTVDPTTVQVFPQVLVTTNDRLFFDSKMALGLTLGVTNFAREAGPFDTDSSTALLPGQMFRPGQDPLREATRYQVTPSLYTTYRAWDRVSLVPSVQFKNYYYQFRNINQAEVPTLSRNYVLLQMDLSTQLERVFVTSDPEVPKVKHWIRPRLTYSLIPHRREPDHPFIRQMSFARNNNFSGYNFDNEDVVPLDTQPSVSNYFDPLGHSLTYGFTTQLVRRRVDPEDQSAPATYQNAVEWTAANTLNIREYKKEDGEQRPLSRITSTLAINLDKFSQYVDYYYTPYQPLGNGRSRHVYSLGSSYTFAKETRHNILSFERSIYGNFAFNRADQQSQTKNARGGFVYSINDYIMPAFGMTYDLLKKRMQEMSSSLVFQSPSECWKLDLGYAQTLCPVRESSRDNTWCGFFRFNFSMNLTGSGFGSVTGAPAPGT